MTIFLKQSTATTVVVGPFVDETDGRTAETALTIAQTDALVWKQGGAGFSAKNSSSAATHRSSGCYTLPLDATDTNTLGQLILSIDEHGALPVRHDFQVVPANVWDSLFGSASLAVNATSIAGVSAAASRLALSAGTIIPGTVTDSGHSPTTSAFKASDITEATNDHFIGRVVIFTSGALLNQATVITDYVGSTSVYTVAAMTEAAASGDTFIIV
jgi:hypothetical protein